MVNRVVSRNKEPRVRLNDPEPQVYPMLPSERIKLLERAEVARYWEALAKVDVVKELNPIRCCCCRHCWGVDFQYQYTLNEMRKARTKHLYQQLRYREHQRVIFDEQGGDGYDTRKKPNPDCPECHGDGIYTVVPIEFDKLSLGARALFDGVKFNKDGTIELKLRSRDFAMTQIQKLYGFDTPPEAPDFTILPDRILDVAVEKVLDQGLVSLEDLRDAGDS